MAVWKIDGTVEEASLGSANKKFSLYKTVRIRDAAGAEHAFTKIVASGDVAKALKPGLKGRVYGFKSLDMNGIHGFRPDDGQGAYSHPVNMEPMAIVAIVAGAFMLVMVFVAKPGILALFPILFLPFAIVFWWVSRKARLDAKAQYDGDKVG